MKPNEIEQESFRIILEELGPHEFSTMELPIVQRVIHATADFEFTGLLRFSPGAIEAGIRALQSGCQVISDVNMIAAGINRPCLEQFSCRVSCLVDDPQVSRLACLFSRTRSEVAMRKFGAELSGAVVAIGNAPTALFEVVSLFENYDIQPALIVGAPVGFVNAVESKQALMKTSLNYITTQGRKGGSTVTVAIINALLRLAGE